MNSKNFFTLLGGFGLGIFFVCCACLLLMLATITSLGGLSEESVSTVSSQSGFDLGDANSENKLLIVNINGVILNERPEGAIGFFDTGNTYGYEIQEQLVEAANDDKIKAAIIYVNSPGGTVTGSNAIAEGIKRFKEKTEVPVIGFGSSLVASGGYWSIAPTDEIIIDKGSIVGSVGVIAAQFDVYNNVVAQSQFLGNSVTTTGGIERITIKSGEGKNFGDPYSPVDQKGVDILQEQSDEIYEQFLNHVASNRETLEVEDVRNLGAYVYSENQAVENGLADSVGGRLDALETALEAAEIDGDDYKVVEIPQIDDVGFFGSLLATYQVTAANGLSVQTPETCQLVNNRPILFHGPVANLCETN